MAGDVREHDLSVGGDVLDRVTRCATDALVRYGCHADAAVRLLNVSENATFLIDDPAAAASVLRVHRHGYHTPAEVESELAWMRALRQDSGVRTPAVLPATDGSAVVTAADPLTGEQRMCVRFEWLPGSEPAADSAADFAALGELTAHLHRHAKSWQRPAWFRRFRWDHDAAFGAVARWGRWQDGIGIGTAERAVLGRLDDTVARRLAAYGTGPDRFGLVHADTRLANLLVSDDGVAVIDFDDSGFSWYLYDAGTSVSFFEHEPQVPQLIDSWLTGYRRVASLPASDEAEIWTFILYRRLLLVAWIGTHQAVDIARELGAGYSADSCDLAERYLSEFG